MTKDIFVMIIQMEATHLYLISAFRVIMFFFFPFIFLLFQLIRYIQPNNSSCFSHGTLH